MSAINDALKRTSEVQQELDTVRIRFDRLPAPPPKPKSAPAPAPSSNQVAVPGWTIPVVVTVLIAAVAFIGIRHFSKKHTAHVAAVVPVARPVQVNPPAPRPASPPATATAKKVAVTTSAQTTPVTPTAWPSLNLQAIFYGGAKSQAIVNGKTVLVGNIVDGIRVAVISQNNVLFIAPDGSQKKLALGQ